MLDRGSYGGYFKACRSAEWDEKRVERLLRHYEEQSEEDAVAEDEAVLEDDLIARHKKANDQPRRRTTSGRTSAIRSKSPST
jgi:hypothetical protein